MPFTPFHMGPGMLAKAAAPRHFSLVVFGLTQIATDLEVLWYLERREYPIHRFFHTVLGATLIAAVFSVLGKPASQGLKFIWNRIAALCGDPRLAVPAQTTWLASFTGAAFGAYSHVLLDSLFHVDIEPLKPWSAVNPLQGILSPVAVEALCVVCGIVGLIWYFARARRNP